MPPIEISRIEASIESRSLDQDKDEHNLLSSGLCSLYPQV